MADITIRAVDGGTFGGYLATPKSGKGPGIIVIQEIFGVNAVMQELTNAYAAEGYTAFCPDLFWRFKPGIQITDKTEAEWKRAVGYFQRFNVDKGIDDLKAAVAVLRQHPACSGNVGSVGYCLGGKLAYLMATRSDATCNVAYYGVGIHDLLGEAKNIKRPLLLHIASQDEFAPPSAQAQIKAALKANRHVTMYDYPECGHAFARPGGAHWNAAAAKIANQRTAEFFHRHLSG